MQKHRLVLGIIVVCGLLFSRAISQQSDIYQLYINNQFALIEELLDSRKINDEKWEKFAQILFIDNLGKALDEYITLYNEYDDSRLKKLIIDRISQYYYARGLYDSADRILKDDKFRKKVFEVNIRKINFGVQLGAFSSFSNAENAKSKYSADIDDIIIINKDSGGKQLYVIVAGKFSSRNMAENLKEGLSESLGIKGMVIQY